MEHYERVKEFIEREYGMPDNKDLWNEYIEKATKKIDEVMKDVQEEYFSSSQLDKNCIS